MSRSWTIGSRPDSDLVVDLPKVSGHHCRLTRDETGYVLEDLDSTNGTYVNGVRVAGKLRVTRGDAITLGLTAAMPWPAESADPLAVVLRIGRDPDNDVVIDSPMVSGHHARVVWEGKPGEARVEDLGSSNGTAVGRPDRKITSSAFISGDTLYLGSYPLAAAYLLARIGATPVPDLAFRGDELVIGRDPACGRVVDLPMVSGRHARLSRSGGRVVIEDLGSSNGTYVDGRRTDGPADVGSGDLIGLGSYTVRLAIESEALGAEAPSPSPVPIMPGDRPGPAWWPLGRTGRLVVLLVQAPLAGLVLAMWRGSAPLLLSWLGLAAVWFGLSGAVLGGGFDRRRLRDEGATGRPSPSPARLGLLAVLCAVQCAVCWAIAAGVAGLRGPGLPSVGLLALAAWVGLAAGLLIVALAHRAAVAWAVVGAVVLVLWLFGGERQPIPRMNPVGRAIANAAPSRWAFEGLLLLESDARAGRDPARGGGPDPAESYFPAETGRTGPRGAAMALGFLLVGLAASAAFTARASRPASP